MNYPLCQKWKVKELSIFGSATRDDFNANSDIDLLVVFHEDADWSLLDTTRMQEELSQLLERSVDLISKKGVERSKNWIRRNAILESARVVYVA